MTRTHMSIHDVEEIKITKNAETQSDGRRRNIVLKRDEGEDVELTSFGKDDIEVKA